jgi:hypothetical protein
MNQVLVVVEAEVVALGGDLLLGYAEALGGAFALSL